MKKVFLAILVSVILWSCADKQKDEEKYFLLKGTAEGIADSTKVYLNYNKQLDSTYIINQNFLFTGVVEEPVKSFLSILATDDYANFWIEKGEITFKASKGAFDKKKIAGSAQQKFTEIIEEKEAPLIRKVLAYNVQIFEEINTEEYIDSIKILRDDIFKNQLPQVNESFIRKYPNTSEAVYKLNVLKELIGVEKTKELFALMNQNIKNTNYGKSIADYILGYK